MIRLRVVKSVDALREDADRAGVVEDNPELLHGIKVTKELVAPWMHSDRVVCGDSYFASVACAKELLRYRLRFIGVVKTANRMFPHAYLSNLELQERGQHEGLVAKDGNGRPELLSFVWVDRERRYFISIIPSSVCALLTLGKFSHALLSLRVVRLQRPRASSMVTWPPS
jgi:Transposase IS4